MVSATPDLVQGDHSPDDVKFLDGSRHIGPCSVLLRYVMDTNMQLTINSFRPLFPDKIFFADTSMTFSKIPDISAVKILDISRFSIQVVALTVTFPA